jgi:DNA replication and repair protein RecF
VIVGPNGHGKTSLIEALLYCEVFRSFRGAADRELVRFGADGFRVEVATAGGRGQAGVAGGPPAAGGSVVAAGYDARTREKKVTVDGAVPERLADAIGLVRGVVLSPADVSLVAGGPRERRHWLDVLLALTVKGYVAALTKYRRALAQRQKASAGDAPAWEQLCAESGAVLVAARHAWAAEWGAAWAERCRAMGEPAEPALAYAPRTDGGADELREAFARTREKDRTQGRASSGPHRDELRLTLAGRPLRHFGSAGQQRTAAIGLRLVEAEVMARGGEEVLVCLDDAFAELDADRSRHLGALIAARAKAGSTIVAAVPKESDVPVVLSDLPLWRMEDGRIQAER